MVNWIDNISFVVVVHDSVRKNTVYLTEHFFSTGQFRAIFPRFCVYHWLFLKDSTFITCDITSVPCDFFKSHNMSRNIKGSISHLLHGTHHNAHFAPLGALTLNFQAQLMSAVFYSPKHHHYLFFFLISRHFVERFSGIITRYCITPKSIFLP